MIRILAAFMIGGFLGMITISMFAARQIAELRHWNRRLQKERDDALENEEMREEITDEEKDDARKYRELMKVDQ